MVITFTDTTVHHPRGLRVKSILVTANEGGPAILQLYPYSVTEGDPILAVTTPASSTTQVTFDNFSIPSGVTLVAGEGVVSFLVEYDNL